MQRCSVQAATGSGAAPARRRPAPQNAAFGSAPAVSGSQIAPARQLRGAVILAAKKGGGGSGKKGSQKKGPGLLASIPKPPQPYLDTSVIMHNLLLIESFFRKTGRPFPLEGEVEISDVPRKLWDAPFAVLAHDAGESGDPKFVYANAKGLELFETTWEELMGMPSRQSAADVQEIQDERSSLLAAALEKGYVDNYEGERRTLKGRNVRIWDTTLFNVDAPSGERVGQAVVINSWEYEDGTKGGRAALEESAAAAASEGLPSLEELAAAEAAVTEQGALVRDLKAQGLANGSEEVAAAVEELLQRKAALEALQQRAAPGATA